MISTEISGEKWRNTTFSEPPRIGGTLVWYYAICSREVWFMCRGIEPDRRDELLRLGRLIDESSYSRERHNIDMGDNRFDVFSEEGGILVIGEVKKSSRSLDASRLQLAHYLYSLEKEGILAEGRLLFPQERRREEVLLDDSLRQSLDRAYEEIQSIGESSRPPELRKNSWCRNCAYREWCWS